MGRPPRGPPALPRFERALAPAPAAPAPAPAAAVAPASLASMPPAGSGSAASNFVRLLGANGTSMANWSTDTRTSPTSPEGFVAVAMKQGAPSVPTLVPGGANGRDFIASNPSSLYVARTKSTLADVPSALQDEEGMPVATATSVLEIHHR
ncbi:hypothetical protein EON66_10310 [archaeon]|nr:MAG: hypothetical protein EON66_10310 [archaeon]